MKTFVLLLLALLAITIPTICKAEKLNHQILNKTKLKPSSKVIFTKAREDCQKSTKVDAKLINDFESVGGVKKPELGAFLTCVFKKVKTMNDKGEWVPLEARKLLSGKVLIDALKCDRPASKGTDTSNETMLDVYECLVKNYRNK